MIKRISSVAVIIAMLFSMMCSFTVYAENDLMQMELTSAPTTVGRGDTVTITAAIKNYTPADTLAVFVDYDSDVLTFTDDASGLDVYYEFNPAKVMGETTGLYAAWVDTVNFEPVDSEGNPVNDFTLWTLTFKVADNAPAGETTLTYSFDEAQCNVWSDEANDSVSLVAGTDYVKDATITLNIAECVHDYTDAEYTQPAQGTAKDEAQHSITCNKCNTPAYEDCSFGEGVYTPATCTDAGYTTYTCSVCGYVVVETDPNAPALEHDYQAVYTEPTFDADGYTTYTCSKCGDSYVVTDEGTQKVAIAQVGDKKYESLEAAIAAAEDGETVTLANDVTLSESLRVDKKVTINLNDKKITSTYSGNLAAIYVAKTGDLTITGEGTIDAAEVAIGNYGKVTIDNGTINGEKAALYNYYWAEDYYGTAVIAGGELNTVWNSGVMDVTGGTVDYLDNSHKLNVTGGMITDLLVKEADYAPVNGTSASVTGGTVANTSAKAKIGNVYYATIEDAIAAAEAGDTIVLLDDTVVSDTVIIDADITLDLGGKTLSAAESLANKPVIRVLADVTVTNGTVDGTTGINSYAIIVGQGTTKGTLNIADGTYKGITSAISVSQGVANISGGEFMTAHDGEGTDFGAQYLLNCLDGAYNEGTAGYVITGGKFHGFNPFDNLAEGADTNFLPEDLHGTDADGDGVYEISKHNYVAMEGKEPNCTDEGYTDYEYCADCDTEKGKTVISATGHKYESVVTAPTCTEKGYTTHTCSVCGDSYVDSYVDATGEHSFVYTHKEVEGVHKHTITCKTCDYNVEENCAFDSKETAPTCTEDGYTTYICSGCNFEYIETDEGSKLGHDYKHDEGTVGADATMSCTRCDSDNVPCDFDDGVKVPSTDPCTKPGTIKYTCQETGYNYSVDDPEVPVVGHKYESVVTGPTCTDKGYTTHTCSVCGDSYEDSYVDALGHDYKHDEGTVGAAATMSCTRCDSDNVPCDFDDGVKVPSTDPCTKPGTIKYTCQETGYNYSVDDPEVPVVGHKYESVVTGPTCTDKGYTTHTCSVCGDSYVDSYVDELDHEYVYTHKGEVEGVHMHTITCKNCDLSEEEACTIGEWTVTEEPTKDKTGTKERSCEKCDYTETAVIAKLAYFAATADPEASAGDEWKVEIAVKNNPGVSGIDLQVAFDGSVMTLIDAEANEAVNGGLQVGNHTNGVTTIALITEPAFEGEETLITLTFKIADVVEDGAYTVKVSTEDATDGAKPMPNQITIEETEVTVNVSDFIWGDVTGNGVCNVDDALYLLRYLAGLMKLEDMEKPQAANTTNDAEGIVNVDDALLILRFLAGLYDPANPST